MMGQLSALVGFVLVSVGEGALGSLTHGVTGRGTGSSSPICQPLSPAPIDGTTAGDKCFPQDWIIGPMKADPKVGVGALATFYDLELRAGHLTEAAAEAGQVSNLVYVHEDPAEDRPFVFLEIKVKGLRFQLPPCFLGRTRNTFLAGDRELGSSIDGDRLTRRCMRDEWSSDKPGMGFAFDRIFDLVNARESRPPDWVRDPMFSPFPGSPFLPQTQVPALPRPADPPGTVAWGRGLEEVTIGEPTVFSIQTRDKFGNNSTDQAHPPIVVVTSAPRANSSDTSRIDANVSLIGSGKYSVSYKPMVMDTVEIAILTEPVVIERQEVALTLRSATAGSGHFTLGLDHVHRTAPIPVYADSDTVADALSAVVSIGNVNVSRSVTNAGLSGAELRWAYDIHFSSIVGDVTQLTTDVDAVSGLSCAPRVTTIVEGRADHIKGSPFRPVVSSGPGFAEASTHDVGQRGVWGHARLWAVRLSVAAFIFHMIGFAYIATKPLRYGNNGVAAQENLPYWKRFLAVSTLCLLSGGAPIVFLVIEGYLLSWVWQSWDTSWGFVLVGVFLSFTFMVMRPLPYRFPDYNVLRHPLFSLWRDYFGLEYVVQDSDGLARLVEDRRNTFLLAQLPHGIMPFGAIFGNSIADQVFPGMSPVSGVVATMLLWTPVMRHLVNWLGVREAGRESIVKMFADGYRGVGVVAGGIAEMFVSQETEDIIATRNGFATIALQGGHVVLPVFAFGVSRTHVLLPGCKKLQRLSRRLKVPLVIFHGAFGLVPYRQKLKLVVGRPVFVRKVNEPTQADVDRVIQEIHQRIIDIYNDASVKPEWETRPLRFSK